MTKAIDDDQAAREKARELRRLIFSQPPEVIQHLADGITVDDECANCQGDIHDAIDEMFCDNGFPDNGILKGQKIYCIFSLPILLVDIAVSGDEGEQTFDWEFSK
jgi:hypothetical protein